MSLIGAMHAAPRQKITLEHERGDFGRSEKVICLPLSCGTGLSLTFVLTGNATRGYEELVTWKPEMSNDSLAASRCHHPLA